MIDDDILASHVRAALDGIEVPADASERVRAARDLLVGTGGPPGEPETPESAGLPSGRPHLPNGSRWVLGSAAALVAVVLVAVVALAGGRSSSTTASRSSRAFERPQPASGALNRTLSPVAPNAAPAAPTPATGQAGAQAAPRQAPTPTPPGQTPDRVIQTGSLILTVAAGHLDSTVTILGDRASGAGGQVAKSQTDESPSGPSADLTLKVPATNFATLLSAVRSLGSATSVNTSAVDVTATYVDLTARLTALEATRAQFLQILAKAQSIGDILGVEAQITPVQTQIEQLQGQQQVLDDQTSFATLDVHVAVPAARAPVARPAGGLSEAWAHARHAFASGIESIVSSLGGIAVFLVCVAVLVGLARIIWAVIRRRLV